MKFYPSLLLLGLFLYSPISAAKAIPAIKFQILSQQDNITILSAPFQTPKQEYPQEFEALEGSDIGLDNGYRYSIRDYTDPFWIGRGTAAGDYNKDGWQDIVFGSNQGFILYKNNGREFQQQTQNNPSINEFMVYAVAFIDLNNDSWLDLFFTTFNQGNYLVLNQQGHFDFRHLISVPNLDAVLTLSPAFADIDLNGQLDIINGNIALGVVTGMHHMTNRRNNSIVFNNNLEFREAATETISGETMATLVSDINNDSVPDIYFGNDFIIQDKILLGTQSGFKPVKGNRFIPYTPFFSMGADTGDINNDLTLDFVVTGTMYTAPFVGKAPIDGKTVEEYTTFKGGVETCQSIKDPSYRKACQLVRESGYIDALDKPLSKSLKDCYKLSNESAVQVCLTRHMWQLITQEKKTENCQTQFIQDKRLQQVCEILQLKDRRYDKRDLYGAIPQDDRNMLYTFNPKTQSFETVTNFRHPGGWTWNSKIVDYDNDGWQDVITSDGTVRKNGYGWNVLMKNIGGKQFKQVQFSAGFVSDFSLYSFALIDMDNDGDLDIIGNSAEGAVQVYRNHAAPDRRRVAISLEDHSGNSHAIGAKITIFYNNKSNAQLREIKASGGYMSFDPAIAYFGLDQVTQIDEIHVLWPDKRKTIHTGPLKAGYHYRIIRDNKIKSSQ